MAAAYAALASLMHIINDILVPPHDLLESLREKVNFLLDYLQNTPNSSSSIVNLENEIRAAAYAAEDLIESHISNQLLLESRFYGEKNCLWQLFSSIHRMCFDLGQLIGFTPTRRSDILYESFDRFALREQLFRARKLDRLSLSIRFRMSRDEKLVFAAQRWIWICALNLWPQHYRGDDFHEHRRMMEVQGYEAYRYFLQVQSETNDENFSWERDLIQRVMEEIRFIIGTMEGDPNFFTDINEANLFYLISISEDHGIRKMISAAWNVVSALRQRLLMPRGRGILKVVNNFHSVVEKVMKVNDAHMSDSDLPTTRNFLPAASPSRVDSRISGKSIVVGFDAELAMTKTQLLRDSSKVEIVSIAGMGGIGKTTLARKVYEDPYIVYHYDIRAWVTVSQEFSVRNILLGLLDFTGKGHDEMHKESDEELAVDLHKSLTGRRYLIVMDDMWDIEVWDALRRLFPDDSNSSRILVTTRLLDVAQHLNSCSIHQMRFLNIEESWNLLSYKVFAEEECPPELKEIGMEISRNCGGLPLAIVVAGGLLSKLSRTALCWRDVANNLISLVAKEDEKCLKILSLSYNRLPHHLKACFLYMGVFPEDFEIPVSKLIHLWVAEGILKPHTSKSLELVADEYLRDLIERSLISVSTWSLNGKVKTCNVHDLLRELCVRNAEKEKFFQVANLYSGVTQDDISTQRRLSIHPDVWGIEYSYYSTKFSSSPVRSLIRTGRHLRYLMDMHLPFKLLRVLDVVILYFSSFPREIIELVNLRYLALTYNGLLPPSILNLWNLQTIIHHSRALQHSPLLPIEIWMMPKLRHLYFTAACFPMFLGTEYFANNSIVLGNLQTLMVISDFKCSMDILGKIPNLKKLGISYAGSSTVNLSYYKIENIVHLHHLETLKLFVKNPRYKSMPHPVKLSFPRNLKNLTLSGCRVPWEYMTTIGALPNLEVLKLKSNAFHGLVWEPIDGQFCQLKFLLMKEINLVHWKADNSHFPSLQHLVIRTCSRIEIPSSFGDISTLQMIEVFDCGPSAVNSAKQIQEEQQDYGNCYLEVIISSKKRLKDVNQFHVLR